MGRIRAGWRRVPGWVQDRPRGQWLRVGVAVCAGTGLFLAGVATGWWGADKYSPRSVPELVVAGAGDPGGDDPGRVPTGATMPDLRGLTEDEARLVLHDVGLSGVTVAVEIRPAVGETGTVVAQDPAPAAPAGATVTLALAAPAVVPDLVGSGTAEALRELASLGATVQVTRQFRPDAEIDRVLAVEPPAGEPLADAVVLTVSTPPSSVPLAELSPIEGGCRTLFDVQVDGVRYDTALRCNAVRAGGMETAYLLNRGITDFSAIVGQADDAEPDGRVRVEVLVDGAVRFSEVLHWGESHQVTIATVDALRLALQVSPVGELDGAIPPVIVVDATLRGGPAEVEALREGS